MTWEYRVVKHIRPDGSFWFDIREIYYNGSDLSWTVYSKYPVGDTSLELRANMEMMLKALDLPALELRGDTLIEVSDD